MRNILKYGLMLGLLLGISFFYGCKKDKVPCSIPTPEPGQTKWEKITGLYKVYDTMGVYLYEMNITHSFNSSINQDSLHFVSFDGEFDISGVQSNSSQNPEYLVIYGYQELVYDNFGKRWKLLYTIDNKYNNIWKNDTIKMNFGKTNINYYIEDLTPYYSCDCKQIAVKQH